MMEIKGKIIYEKNEFDFLLKDDNLNISCDYKEAEILTTFKPIRPGVYSFNGNEKLKENILSGKTDSDLKIKIKVIWSYYDFIKCEVVCKIHCFVLFNCDEKTVGLKIKGQDIFNLFNVGEYLTRIVKSAQQFKYKDESLGKISFYSKFNREKRHLSAFCKVMFEETDDIDNILSKYYDVRALFKFIYHRNLLDFSNFILINKNSKKTGELFVPGENYTCSKSDLKRAVPFCLIQKTVGKLMTDICHNNVYDLHFRDSYSSVIKLDVGKLISLTAGIEHEFGRFKIKIKHDTKKRKQIRFVKTKYKKVLLCKGIRADGRSIIKNAIKHLDDVQLETKIVYILNSIPKYMIEKFKEWYIVKKESFSIKTAATDISKLRNDFAHGETLSSFNQKTVLDLQIIEIAFAYFQFQKYIKNDIVTTNIVEKLFNVRFGV